MKIFNTEIVFKVGKRELLRIPFEEEPSPDLEDIATQVLTDTIGPEEIDKLWGKIDMEIRRL